MSTIATDNLGQLLVEAAGRWPEASALVFPDERVSYAELLDAALKVARGLMGLGVGRGEHVGLLMANSREFVAALFGTALAGAVAVPINTRYRTVELPYVVSNADIRVLLTSDRTRAHFDLVRLVDESLPGLGDAADPAALQLRVAPALRSVVVLGGEARRGMVDEKTFHARGSGVGRAELDAQRAKVAAHDPAIMLYTSGTTAQPNGCLLAHDSFLRSWRRVSTMIELRAGESAWAPAPMFHITGLGPLLFSFAVGASVASDTYFHPGQAVALLKLSKPAVLWAAYPPIIRALTGDPAFHSEDLANTRVMLAVAPGETMEVMQRELGHVRLISLYGSTETTIPTLTAPDAPEDERLHTCGRPLFDGIEICIGHPASGLGLPAGQQGEILVRGPNMFLGYYRNAEKTEASHRDGGWFCTGDLGALDDQGCLRFFGRLKEMLKVGGENVAPAEVEAHLSAHPSVKLVQVVGIPDPRLDQVVAAFVELKPGMDATEEQLIAHCVGRLARFKIPRHVRFTQDWPMSATKVRKPELVERLLAELRAEDGARA